MTSSSESLPATQTAPRAVVPMGKGGFSFENADQLWAIAQKIAKSKLKPKGLDTAEDCFLVMCYGQMYGFHEMEALQSLFVVHGKVTADGQTMAGLIQSHPLCREYQMWVEGEGEERAGCVQSWRKGREKPNDVVRFTLAQARQAKLYTGAGDSAWTKYTDDLLIWKAVARDKRRNWPDAHRHLEVREDIEEPREVRNVTPPRVAPPGPDPLLAQLGTGQTQTIELPTQEPATIDIDSASGGDVDAPAPSSPEAGCAPLAESPEQAEGGSAESATGVGGRDPAEPASAPLSASVPIEIPEKLRKAMRTRVKFLGLTKTGERIATERMESMIVDMIDATETEAAIESALHSWRMPA